MQKKSLSLDEIDRLGELLASIPDPYIPMEADMLDGFLTAIALMEHPPRIEQWLAFVLDEEGRPLTHWKEETYQEIRQLILRRGAQLEEWIVHEQPIDPILYIEEDEEDSVQSLSALTPFADGFSCACDLWPELLQSKSKPVQAALVGILRYCTPDSNKDKVEQDEEKIVESITTEVAFANIDEALADLQACVQEIAEITRAKDLQRTPARAIAHRH